MPKPARCCDFGRVGECNTDAESRFSIRISGDFHTPQFSPILKRKQIQGHPWGNGGGKTEAKNRNTVTPPLLTSTARKAIVGRPIATQSSALRMDLWVTTRWQLPSDSRISADNRRFRCAEDWRARVACVPASAKHGAYFLQYVPNLPH